MGLKEKLQRAAVEVERARQSLVEAERYYAVLFKQAGGSKAEQTSPNEIVPKRGPKSLMSIVNKPTATFTNRVEALILSTPNKEWSYPEIFKNVSDIPKKTVRSLLYRLQRTGKVEHAGRGKWKAV